MKLIYIHCEVKLPDNLKENVACDVSLFAQMINIITKKKKCIKKRGKKEEEEKKRVMM